MKDHHWVVLACALLTSISGVARDGNAQPPDDESFAQYAWPPLDAKWLATTRQELARQAIRPATPRDRLALFGRVTDVGKRPIEGAVILAIINQTLTPLSDEPKSDIVAVATSDGSGNYAIDTSIAKPTELAVIFLFVIAKDHGFAVNSLLGFRQTQPVNLTLMPPTQIEVQATTVDGNPVPESWLAVEGISGVIRGRRRRFAIGMPQLPFHATVKSGANGKLRIGNVPPSGCVSVRVSHDNYPEVCCQVKARPASSKNPPVQIVSPSFWHAKLQQPAVTSPVAIQFPPTDRGFVQFIDDQTGDPIVGAELRSLAWALKPVRTNAQGKLFLLMNPTASRDGKSHDHNITFIPATPNYPALKLTVGVDANQTAIVRIPRAVTLHGIVRNQRDKKSVKEAVVVWVADRHDSRSAKTAARVDEQGKFKITVPEGNGTLIAYHDETKNIGADIAIQAHLISLADSYPQTIDTTRLKVIEPVELLADMPYQRAITVEDPYGEPAVGVRIRVCGSDVANSAASIRTDVNGLARITLKNANPEFTLIAMKGDLGVRVDSQDLRQSGSIRMKLSELATVTGRVLVDGKPAIGVAVELRPKASTFGSNPFAGKVQRMFQGRTDSKGVFRVQVPTENTEDFVILPSSGSAEPLQYSTVKVLPATQCFADDTELFTVRGNREINGTIVDAKGAPIKAQVSASRDEPLGDPLFASLRCCTVASDDKGHFKLTYCPHTPLFLLIRHRQETKVVRIDESQSIVNVQLK